MKDESIVPLDNVSIDERQVATASGITSETKFYTVNSANELTTYRLGPPAQKLNSVTLSGLKEAGERIVAIDMHPKFGTLYGVSDKGYLYRIDPATGQVSAVNTVSFAQYLTGDMFSADFNPDNGMLRIVTSDGRNISINPDTGLVVSVNNNIYPTTARVNGIAYGRTGTATNSSTLPASNLYDINTVDGKLYAQSEMRGTLSPIGTTGLIISDDGGFDMNSAGTGLAVLNAKMSTTYNGATNQMILVKKHTEYM
jgi:outer membrane protein assembly factor BamB